MQFVLGIVALFMLADEPPTVELEFTSEVASEPFSGRVYLMTSRNAFEEPRRGPNWFKPEPFYAWDVVDWKPDTKRSFAAKDAVGFPKSLLELPAGKYQMQAVLDRNLGGRNFSSSPGNGYSKSVSVTVADDKPWQVSLKINQITKESEVRSTKRVKYMTVRSALLSDFYHRETTMKAGVVLPESYEETESANRKYPVIFEIPGFGGTHTGAGMRGNSTKLADGVEVIWVVLNPDCPLGHHVFADSANNGPVAQAFFDNFLPVFYKEFRGINQPNARFVTGHSSGGWSSLWIQVRYPDQFGGVWSTAPDPIDFRDFQRINLYQDENMFKDAKGERRPLARRGDKPVLFYQDFSDMERVMGRGGQLSSFEAVFGQRGPTGKPAELWDRTTGAINRDVANTWKEYDINLYCKKNWSTIGPKLSGKLHVYMGDADTFYLEGAVKLFKQTMEELGSDAKVELFAGKDHGSLMDSKMRSRIAKEMSEAAAKCLTPEKSTSKK